MEAFKRSSAPFVTYFLVAINVLVFIYMLMTFKTTTSIEALIETGAKSNPHIVYRGEWYRLITAAFIHIGFEHLLFNNLSIYFIGQDLERLMGHLRLFGLFIIASIGGNLFSFAFSEAISAGASTGIFGLFVAYIILAKMYPQSYGLKKRAMNFSVLILLNIVTGLMGSGLDNWGHIGGAVFGGLATLVIGLDGRYRTDFPKKYRWLALFGILCLAAGLLAVGWFKLVH